MNPETQRGAIQRMRCPTCGIEMNPHAEKLVVPPAGSEAASRDDMAAIVLEIHQCPSCAHLDSRQATTSL